MSSVFADHRPFNSIPPLLLVVCRFLFGLLALLISLGLARYSSFAETQ